MTRNIIAILGHMIAGREKGIAAFLVDMNMLDGC
jgi:hypothetical protein